MADKPINFDRAADFYDATRGFPAGEDHNAARFLAEVTGLTPDARVLEIGIGTGRVALPLAPYVGAIYGVDISAKMLERLQEKQNGEAVHVAQGDILRLPFPDNSFDAVLIVHILHLVPDADVAVKEAARVLKPNGIAIKCFNRYGDNSPEMTALSDTWLSATSDGSKTWRTRWRRVDSIFDELGWDAVQSQQSYEYTAFTTPGQFLERLEKRQWSNTWSMSDDTLQRGVDAVKAAIDTHFGGDSSVSVPQSAYFCVETYRPPVR